MTTTKEFDRTPRAQVTTAQRLKRIRCELAEISENIFSMLGPLCDAAERHGWDNASVIEGQLTIQLLERERDTLRAELRRIEKRSA
jgi:hypothetical protein